MNIDEIKVTSKNTQFMNIINLVDFIVDNSFDSNNNYHKYLRDVYEALGILVTFTNFQIDEDMKLADLLNELFEIRMSNKWSVDIVPEIGELYSYITEYVDSEIETRMRPLAKFDDTLNTANTFIKQASAIAGAVDVSALAQFDFSKLIAAVNAINTDNKSESNAEAENVVVFNPSAKDS